MSKKPYRAEGWENIIVNDADGNTLVACAGSTIEEAKANAALFAAAPDLLDALIDLHNAAKNFPNELHKDHHNIKAAELTIRKSTNV